MNKWDEMMGVVELPDAASSSPSEEGHLGQRCVGGVPGLGGAPPALIPLGQDVGQVGPGYPRHSYILLLVFLLSVLYILFWYVIVVFWVVGFVVCCMWGKNWCVCGGGGWVDVCGVVLKGWRIFYFQVLCFISWGGVVGDDIEVRCRGNQELVVWCHQWTQWRKNMKLGKWERILKIKIYYYHIPYMCMFTF